MQNLRQRTAVKVVAPRGNPNEGKSGRVVHHKGQLIYVQFDDGSRPDYYLEHELEILK
jgi:hypothetical protein